jgi:hypothetical protein
MRFVIFRDSPISYVASVTNRKYRYNTRAKQGRRCA